MGAGIEFHRYLDLLNERKWLELRLVLSNTLSYNDAYMSAGQYLLQLQDEVEASAIASWRLEILVHDRHSSQVGARIIVSAHDTEKTEEASTAPKERLIEYPQHTILVLEDGKISEIRTITDIDMKNQRLAHVDPSPQPLDQGPGHLPHVDLTQFYTAYIRCINDQTMKTELHKYCHPHVMWCSRRLPLDEYRKLMEDSFEAISGLTFRVRDLIVDEERQQVCTRIEFTGTPVRSYAGVEPNGRSVRFAEHAIYWLDRGKIARVVTAIDWQSYRKQLNS
ncbi:SnoaL-domain-containing protein [Coniochaeta ligniaria NRRL 30616]|uniref:SnoaL-domain-containing protein n=1 Tax=Coniochaeta ligniaria NRRL 30616 TaxID=1408157 RepID=A0A1J7I802_9PEZI|nr:SnoaL-domain-containing protein [Coniochaeta ligniaria NRRL 30616]